MHVMLMQQSGTNTVARAPVAVFTLTAIPPTGAYAIASMVAMFCFVKIVSGGECALIMRLLWINNFGTKNGAGFFSTLSFLRLYIFPDRGFFFGIL